MAWVTLLLWGRSPYGRYLDHGDWTQAGYAASLCQSLPAGHWLLPLTLYAGGWLLMSAAMMLPTALPLVAAFRRMVRRRGDRARLVGLLIGGYLAVWFGFGVAAHALDAGVHAVATRSTWLTFNGWAIGAMVIALAGLFQFSALKDFCLERCRAPLGFILRHWRGRAWGRQSLALGVNHGLYCVGCCWALMLLMFVVGTASVGWMLVLGAVMAAEKALPFGRRLSHPIGLVLLAWSGAIVAAHLA
jgi:predicted metal-binding membrane protein